MFRRFTFAFLFMALFTTQRSAWVQNADTLQREVIVQEWPGLIEASSRTKFSVGQGTTMRKVARPENPWGGVTVLITSGPNAGKTAFVSTEWYNRMTSVMPANRRYVVALGAGLKIETEDRSKTLMLPDDSLIVPAEDIRQNKKFPLKIRILNVPKADPEGNPIDFSFDPKATYLISKEWFEKGTVAENISNRISPKAAIAVTGFDGKEHTLNYSKDPEKNDELEQVPWESVSDVTNEKRASLAKWATAVRVWSPDGTPSKEIFYVGDKILARSTEDKGDLWEKGVESAAVVEEVQKAVNDAGKPPTCPPGEKPVGLPSAKGWTCAKAKQYVASGDFSSKNLQTQIVSRKTLGLRPPKYSAPLGTPRKITIHISEGAQDQSIRNIQDFHMGPNRGWSDIAYHYAIGKYKGEWRIMELRDVHTKGSHVKGLNTGNIGIVILGPLESLPPPEAVRLLGQLTEHLQKKYPTIKEVHSHGCGSCGLLKGYQCPGPNCGSICESLAERFDR